MTEEMTAKSIANRKARMIPVAMLVCMFMFGCQVRPIVFTSLFSSYSSLPLPAFRDVACRHNRYAGKSIFGSAKVNYAIGPTSSRLQFLV